MYKKPLLLLSLLYCLTASSQEVQNNIFKEEIKFTSEPISQEGLTAKSIVIKNELEEPNKIGDIYYGKNKVETELQYKGSLEKNFNKFFKALFKGNIESTGSIRIVFKELNISENLKDTINYEALKKQGSYSVEDNLESLNWKKRSYRIKVDYFYNDKFIKSDSEKIDTTTELTKYSISVFCSNFFIKSFSTLYVDINRIDSILLVNSLKSAETLQLENDKTQKEKEKNLATIAELKTLNDVDFKKSKYKFKINRDGSLSDKKIGLLPDDVISYVEKNYATAEPGFYKILAYYSKKNESLKLEAIKELSYSSYSQRTALWIFTAGLGVLSFYLSYQNNQNNAENFGPPI